jgi:hypothetical protein
MPTVNIAHSLLFYRENLWGYLRVSPFNCFNRIAQGLTPFTLTPFTKTAVTAQRNLNLGPSLAQAFRQQGQNGPAVLGAVDVAGAQITDQGLLPAEDIQR